MLCCSCAGVCMGVRSIPTCPGSSTARMTRNQSAPIAAWRVPIGGTRLYPLIPRWVTQITTWSILGLYYFGYFQKRLTYLQTGRFSVNLYSIIRHKTSRLPWIMPPMYIFRSHNGYVAVIRIIFLHYLWNCDPTLDRYTWWCSSIYFLVFLRVLAIFLFHYESKRFSKT